MDSTAILDTGFLITLCDKKRAEHETAKSYYKYFLENNIKMYVPTVVVAEFCLKQPFTDLPIRNFTILPFNFDDATYCADLNIFYYRKKAETGQRDAVKDDFKIIAQTKQNNSNFLVTEDSGTMKKYCDLLRADSKIDFNVVPLAEGFDVSFVNGSGQTEMASITTG